VEAKTNQASAADTKITASHIKAGQDVKVSSDQVQGDKVVGDKVEGDKIIIVTVNPTPQPGKLEPDQSAQPRSLDCPEPEMVEIPAGPFLFGVAPDDRDPLPLEHLGEKNDLPTFWIAKYPVTCAEYSLFVQDWSRKAPWGGESEPPERIRDHPVTNVSFVDAKAYCDWLTSICRRKFDLPTEMQWVKAARGEFPSRNIYTWGSIWDKNAANTIEINAKDTRSVNKSEVNQSEYGVCDLLGNVWEWAYCKDGLIQVQKKRVVCGGSWKNDRRKTKISSRDEVDIQFTSDDIGFRIIRNDK
jgi:formylglycine-generating enzyme required for sulfatase activity